MSASFPSDNHASREIRNRTKIDQQIKICRELPVVTAINSLLERQGIAIIYDAPGSGKSEQLELALLITKKPHYTFNLRDAFYEAEFHSNNIAIQDFKKS